MVDIRHNATNLSTPYSVVVGLGKTGLSCARFLARQGVSFVVVDSRENPPGLDELQREMPDVGVSLGAFDGALFCAAEQLIVSPGLAPDLPVLSQAKANGVAVLGDIELFARYVDAPVVAISGSNGKSTVTTILGEMAAAAGLDVRVGGNLGTPALDLLDGGTPDLYVLELSSFQLELTESLNARAATVLNISEDHLDRHGSVANYAAIKQNIFLGDGVMVLNADDAMVRVMAEVGRQIRYFSLNEPTDPQSYGLRVQDGTIWLARGNENLLPVNQLRVAGRHNWANALAAIALGDSIELPRKAMLEALRAFPGLPHRCQWLADIDGVSWFEDSKGTNVGATLAALTGMPGTKVVLIAGGQGKGQDFRPLKAALAEHGRAVVLIGEDAGVIARAIGGVVPVYMASSMDEAVERAADVSVAGDCVLLSPACASFDMFENYIARGEAFKAAVGRMAA